MRILFILTTLLTACKPSDAGVTQIPTDVACDDSDSDGVCNEDDVCPDFDDTIDDDTDGIADGCDECPNGSNTVDTDGDGIVDGCDPCPDEAVSSAFEWVTWDTPIQGTTATGSVGNTQVSYTSSEALEFTSEVFRHGNFPVDWAVPNVNPTIRNTLATSNTLTFDRPVVDPVFAFASIGNPRSTVTLAFNLPIEVLWSRELTETTPSSITGLEGYAIVAVPGVHTEIDFDYLDNETYVNFVFGFAGTVDDIDGDGQADFCDPCPEDPLDDCEE